MYIYCTHPFRLRVSASFFIEPVVAAVLLLSILVTTLLSLYSKKAIIDNITDNGIHLSGGEKKKLLLIKCMLRSKASVIIWDEIDAGLDNETKILLRDIEEDILNDPTKIVIKISHIDTNREGFNKVIQM